MPAWPTMASQADVRRIALSLPETSEDGGEGRVSFSVQNRDKQKAFVWTWMERVEPGKPRVPRPDVVAVRVLNQLEKEVLLASGADRLFTEPHYSGFPAVLVRLPAIEVEELRELIVNAWRSQAPRTLVQRFGGT